MATVVNNGATLVQGSWVNVGYVWQTITVGSGSYKFVAELQAYLSSQSVSSNQSTVYYRVQQYVDRSVSSTPNTPYYGYGKSFTFTDGNSNTYSVTAKQWASSHPTGMATYNTGSQTLYRYPYGTIVTTSPYTNNGLYGTYSTSGSISDAYATVYTTSTYTYVHNDDGTKTQTVTITGYLYSTEYSATFTFTVPTIARASDISLSSSSITTLGSVTATISSGSSDFVHSITTKYNNTTYTLASNLTGYTTITLLLSVPSGIRTAMASNNVSGSISLTLTCTTVYNGNTLGTKTATLTVVLPTPTITLSATSVASSSNITWTLSNVDTTSLTYTVTRSYGSVVVYVDQAKGITLSRSVANTNFESYITSSMSGTVTVNVTPYCGTTAQATATKTYTITIPSYTPSIDISYATDGASKGSYTSYWLRYISVPAIHGSASTYYGATISSVVASFGTEQTNVLATYSSGSYQVSMTQAIQSNVPVTVTVTDSRGKTASATVASLNLIDIGGASSGTYYTYYAYNKLTLSAYFTRSDTSGDTDPTGTDISASASWSGFSSIDGNNSATIAVKYGSSTIITYSSITGDSSSLTDIGHTTNSGYPLTQEFNLTATITDLVGQSVSVSGTVPKSNVTFSTWSDGTNNGASFGRMATSNKFEIYDMPIYFHENVTMDSGLSIAGDLNGNATTATNATNATNATTATNANNIAVTTVNPTSSTIYYLPFVSGAGNQGTNANNGVRYVSLEGTSSALGYGALVLGNGTNSGNAGNKYGEVRLYPQTGNYYGRLLTNSSLTANRIYTLPDAGGTVALTSDIPSTTSSALSPTKTSGNSTLTGYKYVYGRVVTIYFTATFTGTTAAGGDVWVGNLNITELPPYSATGGTYNGSRVLSYALTSAGVLTIRTNSQVTTSQNSISASLTYVY